MRVVLDTSVIVSGLISPHGNPAQIIARWLAGDFTLLYTQDILSELEDVLNRAWLKERLAAAPNRAGDFLEAVKVLGEPIMGYANVEGFVRDPFDEMFLVCCLLGNADFLVSVDGDLLTLEAFEGTQIVRPAQFLKALAS
jgi:putative PIN family toxin of toxin-antitoxin system